MYSLWDSGKNNINNKKSQRPSRASGWPLMAPSCLMIMVMVFLVVITAIAMTIYGIFSLWNTFKRPKNKKIFFQRPSRTSGWPLEVPSCLIIMGVMVLLLVVITAIAINIFFCGTANKNCRNITHFIFNGRRGPPDDLLWYHHIWL